MSEAMGVLSLCDGAWDCGCSRSRGACCGGERAFHPEGLSLVLYLARSGARLSLVAYLRRSFRRRECRSLLRGASLTRRLSGGAGARASSSYAPLVGAALLPAMGRLCRSNRSGCPALAGARIFGGRRSCHGVALRRAGWLFWGGVVVSLAFACAHSAGGACHRRSSIVDRLRGGMHRRTCVRMLVARWRSCLRSASVLSRSARTAAPVAWWAADTCAPLCGPLVASRPPADPKNATKPHHISLGPPPVPLRPHGAGFQLGFKNRLWKADMQTVSIQLDKREGSTVSATGWCNGDVERLDGPINGD